MTKAVFSRLCPNPRKRFALVGSLYVMLWVATWYSARLLDSFGVVSLWYLPAGLRFCVLLVFGWRGFVLELIVQLIFALTQITSIAGVPIVEFLSIQTLWRLYNLLASLVLNAAVIFALRQVMKSRLDFSRPRHSALFFAIAILVSALSASAGTFGMLGLGYIQPVDTEKVMGSWMIGDFIGIISVAPFLLVRVVPALEQYLAHGRWPKIGGSRGGSDSGRNRADFHTLLIMMLALLLVFALPWSLGVNQELPLVTLLLLLPLAAVALHHGLRAAVLAFILLDVGLVVLIAVFGQQSHAFQYQIVMISLSLVGLWLGGAVEARNKVLDQYRDFASVSNDLLWEVNREGVLIDASGQLATYAGIRPGQHWRTILGEGGVSQRDMLENALAERQPFYQLAFALPAPGNATRTIQVNGLPLFDESGELTGYRGTAVDVSVARAAENVLRDYNEHLRLDVLERTRELHKSNDELASKERHLQVLLAAAPVGVLELDDAQRCRYLNANGCSLTGCAADEAKGMHFLDFVHADDREYVSFIWQNTRLSEDLQLLEFRLNRTNLRCAAHWIKLSHADPLQEGTIIVLTNATARSQQDEKLWTLAHHDTLTDLPNRNLFWDRLRQALRHAHRHGNGAAVLWIDLDGFKAVNDRLGHAAGDSVLQQVAERLKKRVRDSDTVARLGGDEFAVVMPDIAAPEPAVQIARQLVATLAEAFELPKETVFVSGSIGVALYPLHAESAEVLTQCADMAMYAAKHAGKNQVQVWRGSQAAERD